MGAEYILVFSVCGMACQLKRKRLCYDKLLTPWRLTFVKIGNLYRNAKNGGYSIGPIINQMFFLMSEVQWIYTVDHGRLYMIIWLLFFSTKYIISVSTKYDPDLYSDTAEATNNWRSGIITSSLPITFECNVPLFIITCHVSEKY